MRFRELLHDHSPELLMAVGLVGMAADCFLSVAQAKRFEKAKAELNESGLTIEEYRKRLFLKAITIWGPVIGVYLISGGCILKSNSKLSDRGLETLTMYHIARNTIFDYKEAAVETVGKEKEKEISDKLKAKRTKKFKHDLNDHANYKFYDAIFGPSCMTSRNYLDHVKNLVNEKLVDGEPVPLADFYEYLDMPIPQWAYEVGWRRDSTIGDEKRKLDLDYYSEINSNGELEGYYVFSWWPERWFDDDHI